MRRFWCRRRGYSHTLTQVLRLCVDKPFVVGEAPRALQDLLARAADMPDFASLEVTLKNALQNIHDAFDPHREVMA